MAGLFSNLKARWKARSPLIFRRITNVCVAISGVALAVQTALTAAGAQAPEWWLAAYPYLIGVPAGMAAVAKLTKEDDNSFQSRKNWKELEKK